MQPTLSRQRPEPGGSPLTDVVVVEIATETQGQYAGRLLAEYGARVTRVVWGGEGRTDGSVAEGWLNGAKTTVRFDPGDEAAADAVRDLTGDADIVLVGGEAWAAVGRHLGGQAVVVISPFGLSPADDQAGAPSTPFTRYHSGGDGYFLPTSHDPGLRPTVPGSLIGECIAGVGVVAAALDGLQLAESSGVQHVADFSHQAYNISMNKMFVSQSSYYGTQLSRFTHAYPFGGNVPCADGYVAILILEEHQWRGLCVTVGRTDWLDDPRFADGIGRRRHGPEIDGHLKAWCAERRTSEVIAAGRANDVPIGLVATPADVLSNPGLAKRGFIATRPTPFGPRPTAGLPFGKGFPSAVQPYQPPAEVEAS